jgi:hypothetical protein
MDTLPPPPAVIKVSYDYAQGLDLRDPIHAAAYLKAASHFLSRWPQEWEAETLCLALIADEEDESAFADRQKIVPWEVISNHSLHPMDDSDPWHFVEDLINRLAEDFSLRI